MPESIDNKTINSELDDLFNEISNDELMGENVLEKEENQKPNSEINDLHVTSVKNQTMLYDTTETDVDMENHRGKEKERFDSDSDTQELQEEEEKYTESEKKREQRKRKTRTRNSKSKNINESFDENEEEEELNGPKSEVKADDKILEARRDFEEALSKLKGGRRKKDFDSESVNLDDIAIAFTNKMLEAVKKDDEAVAGERPALEKLKMLQEVTEMLTRKHMQEVLLDNQVLDVMKKWLEPNIRGHLAVHSVKKKILELLAILPIETSHLRESGLGKIVMFYYQRKSEDLDIKKLAGHLITTWSRPIIGLDYREMINNQLNHNEYSSSDVTNNNNMKRLQSDKFKKLAKSGALERDSAAAASGPDARFRKLTSTLNRQKNKNKKK